MIEEEQGDVRLSLALAILKAAKRHAADLESILRKDVVREFGA